MLPAPLSMLMPPNLDRLLLEVARCAPAQVGRYEAQPSADEREEDEVGEGVVESDEEPDAEGDERDAERQVLEGADGGSEFCRDLRRGGREVDGLRRMKLWLGDGRGACPTPEQSSSTSVGELQEVAKRMGDELLKLQPPLERPLRCPMKRFRPALMDLLDLLDLMDGAACLLLLSSVGQGPTGESGLDGLETSGPSEVSPPALGANG